MLQAAQMAGDSKTFLLYYYYGGMIYTAMKRFQRAEYFFEVVSMCSVSRPHTHKALLYFLYTSPISLLNIIFIMFQVICVPATVLSTIMVEAYKKLILVRLILHRPDTSLSKFAPLILNRYMKVSGAIFAQKHY